MLTGGRGMPTLHNRYRYLWSEAGRCVREVMEGDTLVTEGPQIAPCGVSGECSKYFNRDMSVPKRLILKVLSFVKPSAEGGRCRYLYVSYKILLCSTLVCGVDLTVGAGEAWCTGYYQLCKFCSSRACERICVLGESTLDVCYFR